MAWSSFVDIVNRIIQTLENDTDLQNFSQTTWGKPLGVRKAVKRREELTHEDLPIVMITAPSQESEYSTGRVLYRTYTLHFYCGFLQNDRTLAQDEIVKFEEQIEQALLKDTELGGLGVVITPGDSVNDEGFFRPVYFMVKQIKVFVERSI